MPSKDRCQITARHYECDPLGHVNHAVYVNYFEVGRLHAMAEAGLPFPALIKQGYSVVAVDVYVQYKSPAFADDVLDIYSWIAAFRGAVMTWQQEMYRHSTGELVALAEVHGAFTRLHGRPLRIPANMQSLFETVYVPEAAWPATRLRRPWQH